MAQKIRELENTKIEFINFGSGIGTIYDTTQDEPVNLEKLANIVSNIADENNAGLNAKLYIETGRFVVCNAGTYYTLDILDEDVELNVAQIGDVIAVSNAGSYAYTLSPLLFSSHDAPREFLQAENGEIL